MTTLTLRPNGTVSLAGATLTGAASAHVATNDNSDATYFTTSNTPDSVVLSADNPSLPAGAITKQLRMRFRGRAASGTVDGSCWIGAAERPIAVGTTLQTLTGSYVPVTLSAAQLNALTFGVNDQGNGAIRAYELYGDLVYVVVPVVALDAIADPYTASTIVPVSWVNTLDSDGGAQTHYRVWVTDDADGDAVVYTSGIVVSSATSANVGPLTNGEYTVHVEVAQTVNGAQHWSTEDTQAALTVAVDTSDVAAITATSDDTNGLVAIAVTWDNTSETPELVEVERTIDAGDTWEPVRFATLQEWDGAAAFEVDDHEAPPETGVTYRARATYYNTGIAIPGPWVETAAPVEWTATACWIKSPTNPALNRTFQTARPMEAQWTEAVGVHDLLGGGRVVIVGPAVMPTASLIVHTPTEADATALKAIFTHSPFVLIQAPPAWQYDVDYSAAVGRSRARLVAKNHVPHTQWPLQLIACNAPADHTAGSL